MDGAFPARMGRMVGGFDDFHALTWVSLMGF